MVTPPHPDYPSAHAIFPVPRRPSCGLSSEATTQGQRDLPGSVRRHPNTWQSFSEMTEEVDNARVWGGIHFRSADKDGSDIGRKIGTS